MKRFLTPAHLIGLALTVGLIAILVVYWPWPFLALRMVAPDVHKMFVLPYIRDYQTMIGYLVPFVILSVAHALWFMVKNRIDAAKDKK